MNLQFLKVTREDNVLRVLIDRPENRNALSQAVLNEIRTVFEHHAADLSLVAATITGAGERCFAAGGDLREFDGLRERGAVETMTRNSALALDAILVTFVANSIGPFSHGRFTVLAMLAFAAVYGVIAFKLVMIGAFGDNHGTRRSGSSDAVATSARS